MKLKEIIERLQKEDPLRRIQLGFDSPHSFRGIYAELAFTLAYNILIGTMLDAAKSALGRTFQGYKGGDYPMTGETECWLATWGTATDDRITPLLLEFMLKDKTTEEKQTTLGDLIKEDELFNALRAENQALRTELECEKAWNQVAMESNKAVDAYLREVHSGLPEHYGMPVDGIRLVVEALTRPALLSQAPKSKDQILAAWGESCSGPGWSNRLIWVLYRDANGKLQIHGIQPGDQTPLMFNFFRASEAINSELVAEIRQSMRSAKTFKELVQKRRENS